MKEFEKWLEKYTHGEQVSQRYELADTWKAALEWVLFLGDNEEPYTWENIINYKIREELNG